MCVCEAHTAVKDTHSHLRLALLNTVLVGHAQDPATPGWVGRGGGEEGKREGTRYETDRGCD